MQVVIVLAGKLPVYPAAHGCVHQTAVLQSGGTEAGKEAWKDHFGIVLFIVLTLIAGCAVGQYNGRPSRAEPLWSGTGDHTSEAVVASSQVLVDRSSGSIPIPSWTRALQGNQDLVLPSEVQQPGPELSRLQAVSRWRIAEVTSDSAHRSDPGQDSVEGGRPDRLVLPNERTIIPGRLDASGR